MSWLVTLSPAAAPAAVVSTTLLGMLFVIRLVIHFQKDFTDRYSSELDRERGRREGLESDMAAIEKTRRERDHELANAENVIRKLRKIILDAGLELPDDD